MPRHRASTALPGKRWPTTRRPAPTRRTASPPNYDKHVWLFRENPNGVFAPFDPNVSCEHRAQHAHD